ncbi:MAG: DUF937 domain-containing protein [Hyphomicrobium sp.]
MRILDYLNGPQGQAAIDNLAATFGIPAKDAKAAIDCIVPEFAKAIERNTLNRGGIADMVAAMGRSDPAQALGTSAGLSAPELSERGIGDLQMLLGSKDKSRSLAARVARETGLSDSVIKSMLPAVAAVTVAALAKGSRSSLQQVIGKVPALQATGSLSIPGSSEADGTLPRQTPLPIPGDNLPGLSPGPNPYDDLPDVIRRGGVKVPQNGGNGRGAGAPASLDSVIRDILGGLLGFQNRGFMGWLLQAVIVPMLLRIVQSVLRRVLTGR